MRRNSGRRAGARRGHTRENPASGEIIATVPDLDAEAIAELARRGRAAQPIWEAYGFEGRGRVLLRMQKWVMDNADRIVRTIVSETGKNYEDAAARRDLLRRRCLWLLGEERRGVPGR